MDDGDLRGLIAWMIARIDRIEKDIHRIRKAVYAEKAEALDEHLTKHIEEEKEASCQTEKEG